MGQFLSYVLVKGDFKDIETKVAELLAPYDKALQVAEHDAKCPCIVSQVEAKARQLAGVITDHSSNLTFEAITRSALAIQEAHRVAVEDLQEKATPDPNCKDCGGSGTIKSAANPNGKWTRWEIGGGSSSNALAECLNDAVDDPNIVPVKVLKLQEAPAPWVIITPDGKWHTAGEPNWFGTVRIDDRDWDNTARNILQQHRDKTLVVVECQS
jgi:hypothetical protein